MSSGAFHYPHRSWFAETLREGPRSDHQSLSPPLTRAHITFGMQERSSSRTQASGFAQRRPPQMCVHHVLCAHLLADRVLSRSTTWRMGIRLMRICSRYVSSLLADVLSFDFSLVSLEALGRNSVSQDHHIVSFFISVVSHRALSVICSIVLTSRGVCRYLACVEWYAPLHADQRHLVAP